MPFGLRNASQTFQRFMNEILRGLDHALLQRWHSGGIQQWRRTQETFKNTIYGKRLNDYGLTINIAKSVFGKSKVDYLGYRISVAGIKSIPERVKAIMEYPRTVTEPWRFLGILNFYCQFIKNASEVQKLLFKYLRNANATTKQKLRGTKQPQRHLKIASIV